MKTIRKFFLILLVLSLINGCDDPSYDPIFPNSGKGSSGGTWTVGTPISGAVITSFNGQYVFPIFDEKMVISPNLLLDNPLFYRVQSSNGATIDYYGNKDQAGQHTTLRLVCIKTTIGQEIAMRFDGQNRPIALSFGNNKIVQFDQNSKTIIEVDGTFTCDGDINSLKNQLKNNQVSTLKVSTSNLLKSLPSHSLKANNI